MTPTNQARLIDLAVRIAEKQRAARKLDYFDLRHTGMLRRIWSILDHGAVLRCTDRTEYLTHCQRYQRYLAAMNWGITEWERRVGGGIRYTND